MSLTSLEKETIIVFNEEEDAAEIFTYKPSMIRLLDKMIEEGHPVEFLKENSEGGRTYRLPKKLISIRRPVILSDAERERRKNAHFAQKSPSIDGDSALENVSEYNSSTKK